MSSTDRPEADPNEASLKGTWQRIPARMRLYVVAIALMVVGLGWQLSRGGADIEVEPTGIADVIRWPLGRSTSPLTEPADRALEMSGDLLERSREALDKTLDRVQSK